MGNEWPVVRLGNYVDACLGKMLDKEKNKGRPHKYLGNKSVRWGSFDLDNLSEMLFEEREHERYEIKSGDLIICEGGEPGRCAIWKEDVPNMKIQKALHRVRAKKGLENLYLYYWFLCSGRNGSLEQYFTGTTIKHFTGKALSSVKIPLPPVSIQKRIGRLLSSLDNKIQLNRETNKTLEAMAQALFKSWFVDFDPVIDNALAAGNDIPEPFQARAAARKAALAGLPKAQRALFPSEFEETEELGWVPKGWEQSSFAKHTVFKNGFAFKSKELVKDIEDNIPVFKMGHIKRGGGFNPNGTKSYFPKSCVDTKIQEFFAKKGDLLMSMTDMKSNMVILGNTALMPISDKFLVNQRVGRIRSNTSTHLDYPYLYFYTNHTPVVEELRSRANSGVQVNLSTAAIKETLLLVPSEEVHHEFDKQVKAFLERIFANDESILSLEKLRDTLLPKLISGELRLPEAEQPPEVLAQ